MMYKTGRFVEMQCIQGQPYPLKSLKSKIQNFIHIFMAEKEIFSKPPGACNDPSGSLQTREL